MEYLPPPESSQERVPPAKRTAYFRELASRVRPMLRAHKHFGLWQKDDKGDSWRNVSQHCLVEAARADVLGEWVGLSADMQDKLVDAAAVHDAFKKEQTAIRKKLGPTLEASLQAKAMETSELAAQHIEEDTNYISSAASFHAVAEADRIMTQAEPSERELAFLIQFYIDAYTLNDTWATGDDLNKRIDATKGDPNKNAERYKMFAGIFEDLRRAAHATEQYLAQRCNQDPQSLTLLVDAEIAQRINAIEQE